MTEPKKDHHDFCSRRSQDPVNRWRITGTLTTLTELHIGDGNAGEISDRSKTAIKTGDKNTTQHDVETVIVDHEGRAFLPGSSIKGSLRTFVESQFGLDDVWENLLGSRDSDIGGKLIFTDAFWESDSDRNDEWKNPKTSKDLMSDRTRPWWDPIRRTCVMAAHKRDAKTNTVENQKFYHTEYVPVEESFRFECIGVNLTDKEAEAILGLLKSLQEAEKTPPLQLGALDSKDWGRVQWIISKANFLDGDGIQSWLTSGESISGVEICSKFGKDQWHGVSALSLKPANRLQFELVFHLGFLWLVGDARQEQRGKQFKQMQIKGDAPYDAVSLMNEKGQPYISAKSLEGMLRAQAERILRTVDLPCDDKMVLSLTDASEMKRLVAEAGLANALFGQTGWKSPLTVTRAERVKDSKAPEVVVQELLAINRLTGGGADHFKFNSEAVVGCTLSAEIQVDMDRLNGVDPDYTGIGLLAHLFRDFAEGDMVLGRKSSIGYGWAVLDLKESKANGENLKMWFQSEIVQQYLEKFDELKTPEQMEAS